jgi:uncharacterized membrane protein
VFELLFVHPVWAYRAGKLTLASAWPRWLLLVLIAAVAVVVVASLWRRRYLGLSRLLLIGSLQIALAVAILCLLWRPVLNVERVRDRQNVLAIAVDNSGSMQQRDGADDSPARLQQAVLALQAGPLAQLAKTFELRFFAFGSGAATNGTVPIESLDALPTPGAQSRIGDALLNVMQTAGSVPLAGVVLISDGAENGGSLSESNLREIAAFGVPVHTVGVGPERIDNDLELTDVAMPVSVASGSIVTADVNVRHQGTVTTRLRVYDHDALLAAKDLQLTAAGADAANETTSRVRIEFPAGNAGVRDLRFTLDPLVNERNQINNTRRLVLNVPSARRNILYIEGEPRWEFKFIRRAVEGEKSLRMASVVRTTQNKFYRQGVSSGDELANGLPTTAKELFAYDAIIIGSYEAPALTPAQHELLRDFVDRRGGSVLMLAGRNGLSDGGWGNSALAQAFPVHLPVKRSNDFVQESAKAVLTSYGMESTALRFDGSVERNLEQWKTLPDLANYQRLGNLKPGAVVLLEAQIKDKREPLLVWQRYGRGSVYVLATASTQRWQMSLPAEDQRHEMFWRQLLHAIADQAAQKAQLSTDRQSYEDERAVQIDADLRDDKFEPLINAGTGKAVPQTQVELTVTPESGPPIVQSMRPTTVAGHYAASVDASATGLYKVEITARDGASANKSEPQIVTTTTAFRRDDNVVEHFDMRQHRAVLQRLATDTAGRYWQLDQLDALSAAIPYTKSGIVERQMLPLWNLPFVFLLLMALKLGEWWLRLRWGTL